MNRCIDCNSLLTKEERVCPECGSRVPDERGVSSMGLAVAIVSILFYLSLAAIPASLFLTQGPDLKICILVAAALSFLMRTMKDRDVTVRKR